MPTDVSTPVWACNVCHTRHGERLETAQACEASPVPPVAEVRLSVAGGSFHLVRLTEPTLRSRTTQWQPDGGHYWQYKIGDDTERHGVDGDRMVPGTAGTLQLDRGPGRYWATGADRLAQVGFDQLAAAVGLPVTTTEQFADSGNLWVGPITDEVRALFGQFGTRLTMPTGLQSGTRPWVRRSVVSAVLHGTEPSHPTAQAAYRMADHTQIVERVIEDWRAWWDGAPITVPAPWLTASERRTPSNLTKQLRAMVDDIGVPWRARTNATDYVRTVLNVKLGVTMTTENRLFAGRPVIAVGGARGGVGKSTLARWLAQELAGRGRRVLLLDLDVVAPSQHLAFGLPLKVQVDAERLRMLPEQAGEGLVVFSAGQMGAGSALPTRWGEKDITAFIEFVGATLDVDQVDVIVADLPAGLGVERSMLAAKHRVNLSSEVVVTTADTHALGAAASVLRHEHHEDHARLLVENMATVTGLGPDGDPVTVRLRGTGAEVPALAEQTRTRFVTALPWAADGARPSEVSVIADALPDVITAAVRA